LLILRALPVLEEIPGVVFLSGLGLVYGCYKLDVIRRKKITQKEEEQIQSARNFEL
jgi:hypothetical protein